jgi:hypothetical protein
MINRAESAAWGAVIVSLLLVGACATPAGPGQSTAVSPTRYIAVGSGGRSVWAVSTDGLAVSGDQSTSWMKTALPVGVAPQQVLDAQSNGQVTFLATTDGHVLSLYRRSVASAWVEYPIDITWPKNAPVGGPPQRVVISMATDDVVTIVASVQLTMTESAIAFFESSDGGANFAEKTNLVTLPWSSTAFASASNGVVMGGAAMNRAFFTTDGGATWSRSTLGDPAVGNSAHFGSPIVNDKTFEIPVFQFSDDGDVSVTLYQSDDGGARFDPIAARPLTIPSQYQKSDYVAIGGQGITRWVLPTGGGVLYVTADDGKSWQEISSKSLPANVLSVAVSSSQDGTIVASRTGCTAYKSECSSTSAVYSTVDGGTTWTED